MESVCSEENRTIMKTLSKATFVSFCLMISDFALILYKHAHGAIIMSITSEKNQKRKETWRGMDEKLP